MTTPFLLGAFLAWSLLLAVLVFRAALIAVRPGEGNTPRGRRLIAVHLFLALGVFAIGVMGMLLTAAARSAPLE